MERARETWTDERMDDLSRRMDDGFGRVDQDIRSLRVEMNGRFEAVDARFTGVDGRIDNLQRTMIQVGGGIIATMVVGFLSLLVAQL
jgi:hypothetical protein